MKYFIVGLHSAGKQEVADHLNKMGVKCGKLFSNLEEPSANIYNSFNYEYYSNDDINIIFENNAYIFIQELPLSALNFKTGNYYEGLSKYTFDNNDVFILSPDQLLAIPPNVINEPICFVWMDSTKLRRMTRFRLEKRAYSYNERDDYERRDLNTFVKTLYSFNNSQFIYFTDEDPLRVATIIYNTIIHPDTLQMFVNNFN
jgi:hypothetical protein